jgi:hypothetical protein
LWVRSWGIKSFGSVRTCTSIRFYSVYDVITPTDLLLLARRSGILDTKDIYIYIREQKYRYYIHLEAGIGAQTNHHLNLFVKIIKNIELR